MGGDDDGSPTHMAERLEGARIYEDPDGFSRLTAAFYRGELDRAATWRGRLDQTTNWAVVFVAAILTWSFSSPDHPHYVVLIGMFGVTAFLAMEANRYREYDIWRERVRILQEGLFADMYEPEQSPGTDWRSRISEDLRNPTFTVSFRGALTHRLRRSYLALLLILLAAWIARVTLLESEKTMRETASILGIPGEVVIAVVSIFYAAVVLLAVWSARGTRVREFDE